MGHKNFHYAQLDV